MRVPCAQATVSRYARRGLLAQLDNGRLTDEAVEQTRALLAAQDGDDGDDDLKRRLDTAMARIREAQAQIRELELERESGRFVELAAVQRAGRDAAQRILAVLRAMPQRIALACDGALAAPADRRAAAIEKIIAREVERAVGEMRESMYLGEYTPTPSGDA